MRALYLVVLGLVITSATLTAGDIKTDGKLISTATSGAPLEVASTERVANLNADQLDGLEGTDLYTQSQIDALLAFLQAQISDTYTEAEVDALLASLQSQLDDTYSQAEVDGLIASLQSQIDALSGGSLLVMDDQDLVVGEVFDSLPTNPSSSHRDVRVLLRLGIHRVGATAHKDYVTVDTIHYLLTDCAGPEYIQPMVIGPDGTSIHQEFQITGYGFAEGYVLFRAPPSEIPVQLVTASVWDTDQGCQPSVNNIDLVLAEEIATLGFTPPFRIVDQGSP